MPLNKHPHAKIFTFSQPFFFETPWLGQAEYIPRIEVAYESWGNPSHPAILVCHPLSANTHCTDNHPPSQAFPKNKTLRSTRPWWPDMVGPNKPIDTNRFQVLCINMLGGCGGTSGPASIKPDAPEPYGLHFPMVTIGDMVRAQYLLLQSLGIQRLHCIIGGSMGGFQALEWAISYPHMVDNIIVIASAPYSTQFQIMTNRAQIEAIQRDVFYQQGHYLPGKEPLAGLMVARQIGYTTFISPQMMERKFVKYHRSRRAPTADADFHLLRLHEAENYLRYVSNDFTQDFDANSMIYLLQTWSHFDLNNKYHSLPQALAPAKVRILAICATGDNLFPPSLSRTIQRAAQKAHLNAQLVNIKELYGHDFFLLPEIIQHKLSPIIQAFLQNTAQKA